MMKIMNSFTTLLILRCDCIKIEHAKQSFVRFAILHSINSGSIYDAKIPKRLSLHTDNCIVDIELDLFASLRFVVVDIFSV